MEELIKKVAAQVGISEAQAKQAVEHTLDYLKSGGLLSDKFADFKEDAEEKLKELKADAEEKLKDASETLSELKEDAMGMINKFFGDKKDEPKA